MRRGTLLYQTDNTQDKESQTERRRRRQRLRQRPRQIFGMHCWLRAISSVWLLFLLCCGPFSLRALGSCTNGSVPPRTRLGIVCYEIAMMVRQMTRRIFWRVVMSDMAHLNRLVLQPQQQRLIADPLPHVQPRALPRRSPSSYAWQVEVAAGKLVMSANKLMCKELGAGARCRLRKAAANQITALRYVSESVGAKSFERATRELRAELDTPALAEALKATERNFVDIRTTSGDAAESPDAWGTLKSHRHSCKRGRCQPFLQESLHANANYQVQNLRQFVCELEQHSQVRRLNIVTHLRSESQLDQLERLKGDQQRIVIEYQFSASLNEREFVLGSTHVVVCDRGLDVYTAMRRGKFRTRQCIVLYFEVHGDFKRC